MAIVLQEPEFVSTGAEVTDIIWVWRNGYVVPIQLGLEIGGGDLTLTGGDLYFEKGANAELGTIDDFDMCFIRNSINQICLESAGTVFNPDSLNQDLTGKKLTSGNWMAYDSGNDTLELNTVAKHTSLTGTTVVSSTTETVAVTTATDVEVDTALQTLSLSGMVADTKLQIRNRSTGDAYLNFDIELQGTTYSAPVTMPSGDSYELTYNLADTRWVM